MSFQGKHSSRVDEEIMEILGLQFTKTRPYKNEKTITNIKEIERVRSDELQKLRKQVEVFAYEQQGWARQREEMATKVDHIQGKLIT